MNNRATITEIACLGPAGTFSEEAASFFAAKYKASIVSANSFIEVISMARASKTVMAVVPVENSVEGTVSTTLDLLVTSDLIIEAEYNLSIVNNLLALPQAELSKITDIMSHPQSLAQCQQYIRTHWPQIQTHVAQSTAEAAAYVARLKQASFAAIGTASAAKHYRLVVLADNINDYPENVTRFVLVGHKATNPTGRDKTSIVFSLAKDRPGGLYNILGEFAKDSINLTKIESRPAKKEIGDYLFFIDMEGHQADDIVGKALKAVSEQAAFYKNLGSYPRAK